MKTYRIAILGATGAVGQEMLRVLVQKAEEKRVRQLGVCEEEHGYSTDS